MSNFFIINKNHEKLNIITHKLDNIKAILIHLHGLHAHFQHIYPCIDDFYHRIKYLKKANILSYALEFNGHGKSSGYRGSVYDFNLLIEDISRLMEYIKLLHPNIPVFLVGESMGGAMAIIYGIKKPMDIKGIICLAPMIGLSEKVNIKKSTLGFVLFVSKYFPKWKLISKKNRNVLKLKEYNHFRNKCSYEIKENITLETARECFNASQFIKDNRNKFNLPLLLFHSKHDHVTSFNSSKEFFDNCESNNKQFIELDDTTHCVLVPNFKDDCIPDGIISKITNWINSFV